MVITLTPVLLLVVYALIFVPKTPSSGIGMDEWLERRHSQKKVLAQKKAAAHDPITAWTVAQAFVTSQLKSPATAKFPWYSPDKVKSMTYDGEVAKRLFPTQGRYVVTAYVDSQNSFSAMVRTPFICIMRFDINNIWVLEEATPSDKIVKNPLGEGIWVLEELEA